MIVVADTNWLISYLIKKEASQLRLLLLKTSINIISSDKQINEFLVKVYHPRFRKYFEIEDALLFIKDFAIRADFIEIKSEVDICRDAKDNFLLSLSKDSKADFNSATQIVLEGSNLEKTAGYLNDYLKQFYKLQLKCVSNSNSKNVIRLNYERLDAH